MDGFKKLMLWAAVIGFLALLGPVVAASIVTGFGEWIVEFVRNVGGRS